MASGKTDQIERNEEGVIAAPLDSAPPVEAQPPVGSWRRNLSAFRHDRYRSLWIASLLSNVGGQTQTVAASWLMASITSSSTTVALVQSAMTGPLLITSLLAGAIADTYDRRSVMLVAQAAMLTVALTLAAFTYLNWITPGLLLLFTALMGAGTALNAPAWQASVRDHVPADEVGPAAALNSLQVNVARSAGPAVGGAVVSLLGPAFAFLLNGLSYLGLIAVLLSWSPDQAARSARQPLGPAIMAGLRYVRGSSDLRGIMVRGMLMGTTGSGIWALMPLLARDGLLEGPSAYGLLMASFGCGAVAGAFCITPARIRFGDELTFRFGTIGFALSVALSALVLNLPITTLAMFGAGFSWLISVGTLSIRAQVIASNVFAGRAMSVFQMVTFGGVAIGSWLFGLLADRAGLTSSLMVSAAAVLATLILARQHRFGAIR